jgi:hypothetical protein
MPSGRYCQVAREEDKSTLEPGGSAILLLSDTMPQFSQSTSDKTVLLKAALED